jgi:hypothetical protein
MIYRSNSPQITRPKRANGKFGLKDGSLVELVPGNALDVSLYWQQARAASTLLDGLTRSVVAAGRSSLAEV